MRKEFKLLNTTVVWGTCHRHGSNAKAHQHFTQYLQLTAKILLSRRKGC